MYWGSLTRQYQAVRPAMRPSGSINGRTSTFSTRKGQVFVAFLELGAGEANFSSTLHSETYVLAWSQIVDCQRSFVTLTCSTMAVPRFGVARN